MSRSFSPEVAAQQHVEPTRLARLKIEARSGFVNGLLAEAQLHTRLAAHANGWRAPGAIELRFDKRPAPTTVTQDLDNSKPWDLP